MSPRPFYTPPATASMFNFTISAPPDVLLLFRFPSNIQGGKTVRRIKEIKDRNISIFPSVLYHFILHFRQTEHVQFAVVMQPTIFKRFLNRIMKKSKVLAKKVTVW